MTTVETHTMARRLTKRLSLGLGLVVVVMIALAIAGDTFLRGIAVGVLGVFVVATAGWAAVVLRGAKARGRASLEAPVIPTGPWNYSMAGHELDGPRISFSQFADGVLVLTFWFPWHGPSMRQMPSLQRLREATSGLGVHFACVTQDSDSVLRDFLSQVNAKPTLPLYVLDGDLPEQFRGRIMPATFVVARGGAIVLRQVGPAMWDHESVATFVKELASGPTMTTAAH